MPGFDRFRVPARLLLYFVLASAALSALVLDALIRISDEDESDQRRSIRNRILGLGIAGGAGVAALYAATPSILRALEMPFFEYETTPQHPLAEAIPALIRAAQRLRAPREIV